VSYEIILVDNASTDYNADFFKEDFPSIILIKSNSNLGFSKGNNLGISRASGRYILLLNSDTILLNDALSLSVEIMEKTPSIGVLTGQLLSSDGTVQANAERFPDIIQEIREFLRINKLLSKSDRAFYYLGSEWNYDFPVEADWVWGTFFLFKKDVLTQFPDGKLHEDYFMYGEDRLWCHYFKKVLGLEIYYHPSPKVVHYMGKSGNGSITDTDKYYLRILPNLHDFTNRYYGRFYSKVYFLIKTLLYLSFFDKISLQVAKKYFHYVKMK
jgi:GT2 family glycosyltransferase